MQSNKFTAISVHRELHHRLKVVAAVRGISLSELIEELLSKYEKSL